MVKQGGLVLGHQKSNFKHDYLVKILDTIFAKCMLLCRNVDESLGHKNCKRLAAIPSSDDTFVMGGF